ncbi:MAG: hypothetical protein Q8N51_16570, partial [Gammaproteobacteria bacterium]|nr:hypothetical protein [Gammaproteobacteria bacterium]
MLCACLLTPLAASLKAVAEDAAKPVAAAASAAPAPPATTAELVQRLDAVSSRLRAINEYLRTPAPDLAGITVALPGKSGAAEAILGEAEAADPLQTDLVELAATVQKLRNLDRIFGKWRKRLQEEIVQLDPWSGQLRTDAGFLRDAADPVVPASDRGGADGVPEVLRSRLRQVANDLEATRQPLRRRLDVVVAADVRVGDLQASLRELEGQLDATRLNRQEETLALTAPPLWKPPASLRAPLDLGRQNFATLKGGIADYVDTRSAEITVFLFMLLVLLVAVSRLRRSVLARGETEADQLLT